MFRPSATNKGIRGKMAPYDVSHQLEGAVGSMKTNERSRKVSLKMSAIDYEMERKPTAPKIIIAGAPAAGKGTQCEVITAQLGVIHLSTGDILRAAVKEGSDLGKKAKEYMDSGQLVPDELITGVVVDRLQQPDCLEKGWLLDGFPRTRAQADALSKEGILPDCFILLDVPQEILVERVTGRRTDPETGKIYHMKYNPPPSEIESRLVQRSDDTAEKIIVRYEEFKGHVESVKSCYEDKLIWIDGSQQQRDVSKVLCMALGEVESSADKIMSPSPGSGSGGASGGFGVASSSGTALYMTSLPSHTNTVSYTESQRQQEETMNGRERGHIRHLHRNFAIRNGRGRLGMAQHQRTPRV